MSKGIYVPQNGVSKGAKKWYVPVNELSKNVLSAYCSVDGVSKQFWPDGDSHVIFNNGVFSNVPQGFDITNNFEDTTGQISDLSEYYLTNKLLWVHEEEIDDEWIVNNNFIDSNYSDYDHQIIKNEIYIPINEIYTPSKLKITAKGNLWFNAYYINDNKMVSACSDMMICNNNQVVKELDLSDNPKVKYIKLTAPANYIVENEDVTNPYVYQPIPFVETNHIYTNNASAYNLPGMEINQVSGGTICAFLKYREPDNSNQCIYMMSTEAFSVEVTYRFYNRPTYETWNSELIQSNPPIYKIEREGYWWGYKPQNLPYWHTNYYGGWNTYYDIDVGNIVLYGIYNTIRPLPGVFDALQLIRRIEVIK